MRADTRNSVFDILISIGIVLVLCNVLFSNAKEIEPTKEWQLVKGNDTIPAGMHVRMDMTTGEKWVKIMSDDDDGVRNKEDSDVHTIKDVDVNSDGIGKSSASVAVVETNGDIRIEQNGNDGKKSNQDSTNYNFEMMHRTLSKLPPEEIEAMGGLPELPDSSKGPSRTAFEERMLEIWKKRQAELLELELNFPEILKARIKGIKEYLENPLIKLEDVNLDADFDDEIVTDIVSLLKDLEFQLSDIDMARDFHTMNGWPLLVKLLSEGTHVPLNKTIHDLPQRTKAKIRTVQSHAAWAIGTAVKNTEEFFPYGVESVVLDDTESSTAIDLLLEIFCDQYDDSNSWEIRTLLSKSIYAIGAILRGNKLAQTYIVKTNGFDRLGQKYKKLSQIGFSSVNTKLIQRIAGLSSDIIEDLSSHTDFTETKVDTTVIHSMSSTFCEATCELFSSQAFVPVAVQETLVKAISVIGPFCLASTCSSSSLRSIVETIQSDWLTNKNDLDSEYLQELLGLAREAINSFESSSE